MTTQEVSYSKIKNRLPKRCRSKLYFKFFYFFECVKTLNENEKKPNYLKFFVTICDYAVATNLLILR